MAVTKILNIKQSVRGSGTHLKNAIYYIMNPEKTKENTMIGGNAGSEPNEVYQSMLDTKKAWEKLDGRQGYHMIISWKPGEVEEETAYQVLREFCEEYLGESYDYVFALHDDKEHVHGHIIFNSVNRISGYKYRYEKGDWEKFIQPVTDRICERHGLKKLEYDRKAKLGKSYAEWDAGKKNWKTIIRADIDYAVTQSNAYEDFLGILKGFGYEVKTGKSRTDGEVLSLKAPGQKRAWRTKESSLGEHYTLVAIRSRIGQEKQIYSLPKSPRIRTSRFHAAVKQTPYLSRYQVRKVRELHRTQHRFTGNPFAVDQSRIRKNLIEIDQLHRDCQYLLRMQIRSQIQLEQREEELVEEEQILKERQKIRYQMKEDSVYQEYRVLQQELSQMPVWDDRFEDVLDQLEAMEMNLPLEADQVAADFEDTKEQLAAIRREKQIIRHIKKKDQESLSVIPLGATRQRTVTSVEGKSQHHRNKAIPKNGGDQRSWKR